MFLKKCKGKFIFCLGETVTPVVSMLSQVKTMFALSANIAMVVFTCVFNSVILILKMNFLGTVLFEREK